MDKVLKQRLVGASILIALAVIFLPMVFDSGEDDRAQRQLTLDLPDRPGNAQREVRRLPLDPDQTREVPAEAVAEPPEPTESTETRTEPDDPEPVRAPEPDSETVSGEPSPEPEPESRGVADPEPEPAPEPELVEAESENGWIVQVAVFSNPDTANRIRDRLDGLGHAASVSEMERDEARLYRLLAGPYATRDQADQARGQISATVAGLDPLVRALEDPADLEQTAQRSGYSVQVGSFASRNNAERLVGQLEAQGHDAFMHSEESGGRMIWRVRVGIFDGRDPAESLLAELRERAGLEGIVVTHP